MENKKICANCDSDLDVGVDAIRVETGVIGMKGFVPLESKLFFCCEDCLRDYHDISGLPSVPRRIP